MGAYGGNYGANYAGIAVSTPIPKKTISGDVCINTGIQSDVCINTRIEKDVCL